MFNADNSTNKKINNINQNLPNFSLLSLFRKSTSINIMQRKSTKRLRKNKKNEDLAITISYKDENASNES